MHRLLPACLVFIALVLFNSVANAAPELKTESLVHDFGEVLQGDTVSHVFSFENVGDEPLVIERIKSSCGCTAAMLSEKTISPGGTGTLRATFDSTRFSGKVRKTIFLFSNLPQEPQVRFAIEGEVRPVIESVPAQLDFGPVIPGEEKRLDLTIRNASERTLTIVNIRTSNTALRATAAKNELLPGEQVAMEAYAAPVTGTRHLNGYLLLRTDDSRLGEIRIPVRGFLGEKKD